MITVLLSVFNGDRWLEKSINSILEQTYRNFEFLIINDGSKDNSLKIIDKYLKKDKRIRLISHENMGLTKSLNVGISNAKGNWIARIDSDDIACPRRLELQIIHAIKNDLGLVGCQSNIIDENENFKKKVNIPINHNKIINNLKKQKASFSHSSVLFKKNLVLKLGGYRESMEKAQDYDLWLRISEVSKVGAIKYTGVLIRDHGKRISSKGRGIDQRTYAHYSNISYILRRKFPEVVDPLDYKSNSKIDFYKKFVKDKLINSGSIEFYEKLQEFKSKTFKHNLLKKIILIPVYFNNIYLIYKLFLWLLKGDFISYKIAKAWIKETYL